MVTATFKFVERHWLLLASAVPIVAYGAWIASLVVPEIVKAVAPEVVHAVTSG